MTFSSNPGRTGPPSRSVASGSLPLVEPGFGIETALEGDATVLRVTGEVDLATSPQLREACEQAAATTPATVRVDLTQVTFLDSTGISVLVQMHKRLEGQGGALVLHGLSAQARRVLEVAGLDAFFRVTDERNT